MNYYTDLFLSELARLEMLEGDFQGKDPICQIMLNYNYDKLVIDDVVTKNRLERNIVSNI